jgi:hypothetical protein
MGLEVTELVIGILLIIFSISLFCMLLSIICYVLLIFGGVVINPFKSFRDKIKLKCGKG